MLPAPLVSEALSTSFKCAEFAHPPPHDAFFMDSDADVPLPSIERNHYDDIAFRPSSASLLLSRHRNSSPNTSSRTSSPSRRHYLATAADGESRTSTPASDFSSSLLSKYGGVNGPGSFHATATASPGSTSTPLNDLNGLKTTVAGEKKYPGLLHPHPHRQSKFSESNMMPHAHNVRSPTPTSRRHHHHQHKHKTPKKSSSSHHSSDARDARPLILLHATVLPVAPPAALSTMAAANLPWHVQQNWRLLEQKLSDPVLMSRGLLLPHPRDEYDLLEERLLEALELKTPRVWRCGHFYGSEEGGDTSKKRADSAIGTDEERPESLQQCATDSFPGSNNAVDSSGSDNEDDAEATDVPVCTLCREPLHVPPSLDSGAPNRWDIRIFAANGLMRSSAWSAAWSEMERVDVAITPLLTSAQRLALAAQVEREARQAEQLEMAREEESRLAAAQRVYNQELERERQRVREMERERALAQDVAERQEADKLRYMAAAAVAAAAERRVVEERARDEERRRAREVKELEMARRREDLEHRKALLAEKQQMPLSRLLGNCVVVLATDKRTVAALLLGVFIAVFWVCFGGSTAISVSQMVAQGSNANTDEPFAMTPITAVDGNAAANSSLHLPFDVAYASAATVTLTVTLFLPSSTPSPSTLIDIDSNIESQSPNHSSTPSAELAADVLELSMADDEPEATTPSDAANGMSKQHLDTEVSLEKDNENDLPNVQDGSSDVVAAGAGADDTDAASGRQCRAKTAEDEDALFSAIFLPLCPRFDGVGEGLGDVEGEKEEEMGGWECEGERGLEDDKSVVVA
ncbi:hypothetical protein IWX49DRAFT_400969 [Phyllosticta citricarpa]